MACILKRSKLFQNFHQISSKHFQKIVFFCVKARAPAKEKAAGDTIGIFVDQKQVKVQGGRGGDGCLSFLSMPRKEFAGPDGGDGGNGGHVYFVCDSRIKSLNRVQSYYRAEDGFDGHGETCHGRNGEHVFIQVPLGTCFKDDKKIILAELNKEGQRFMASRGGAGGKGNHYFLTNENRAPFYCEDGSVGESRVYDVELRSIADVGLIGFPNAGKSSILRIITRARPKVAPFPFTTRKPHIGVIEYDDCEQVSVADIPGLIRDAHMNRGLGTAFLKHVEQCPVLLYVLDASLPSPWEQFDDLHSELEHYQPGLSSKAVALIANKVDLLEDKSVLVALKEKSGLPVLPLSALKRVNVNKLIGLIRRLVINKES